MTAGPLLAGRRVLLTGASRGIGRAAARRLVQEGAVVVATARDGAALDALSAEVDGLDGTLWPVAADLVDPATPARLAAAVADRCGALDVLVSNAGVVLDRQATFEDEPPGTLAQTLAVNLLAPHDLVLALLPALRAGKDPHVVHLTSGAGTTDALDDPGLGSYRLSKWALNGLVRLQAAQLRGQVRVNALDPGWVRTGLGGDEAPGHVDDSVAGLLALLAEPDVTGRLHKDGQEIPY